MKLLIVFGTRPEAIKMAPLVKELQKSSMLELKVCVTAQHRQMLDQVLQLFAIAPHYDLDLMRSGQTLPQLTSNILMGMDGVLADYRPDWVLVHGDTSTTMATSLAAYYRQVGVAHVEAGLRTHNLYSPWPEEGNRQITGRLAALHFAPTEESRSNLLREGISAIVAAELRFGASKLGVPRFQSAVEAWLAGFDLRPWPLNATHHYAQIRTSLERSGKPIGGMDLMTAAHVLAEDGVLITNNAKEFHRVPGLPVEEWAMD